MQGVCEGIFKKNPTNKHECIVHSIFKDLWENEKIKVKLNGPYITPSKVMRKGKKPSTYKKKIREWEKEGLKIT